MSFHHGEIIVRDDTSYPQGALVVDGFDASGNLLAHPMGGGPQFVIPSTDLPRFTLASELERTSIFCRATFEIEGSEEQFAGWSDGQTWNGWAMPFFEFTDAGKVIAALASQRGRYDSAQDAFVTENEEGEQETWPAETIELPDGGQMKVYPIGAGSWIWDKAEEGGGE